MGEVWAELRYGSQRGFPIARTKNRRILGLIAEDALREAQAFAEECADVDDIAGIVAHNEARQLKQVLRLLGLGEGEDEYE